MNVGIKGMPDGEVGEWVLCIQPGLGREIEYEVGKKGIDISRLPELLGANKTAVRDWLGGKTIPPAECMAKLTELLGLEHTYFMVFVNICRIVEEHPAMAKNLLHYRMSMHWSRRELSRRSGVPVDLIEMIETGQVVCISQDNLNRLCWVLGAEASNLLEPNCGLGNIESAQARREFCIKRVRSVLSSMSEEALTGALQYVLDNTDFSDARRGSSSKS